MPNIGADIFTGGAFNTFGGNEAGAAEFGRRIKVPELPSMTDILKGGTAANVAALPGIKKFAADVNRFNQDEITRMLESTTPGLLGGIKSATKNAAALARGEIPEDVSSSVWQSSAAKAAGGGFAGAGIGRNLKFRDLGIASLAGTGEGQNRLMSLGAFSRNLFPVFDFSTAFLNSGQMLDYTYSKFQRDLLSEEAQAAPDPVARGNFDMQMAIAGMAMSAYAGGAGYGGAFRQGYSGGGNPASKNPDSSGGNRGGSFMGYGGSSGASEGFYRGSGGGALGDWGSGGGSGSAWGGV